MNVEAAEKFAISICKQDVENILHEIGQQRLPVLKMHNKEQINRNNITQSLTYVALGTEENEQSNCEQIFDVFIQRVINLVPEQRDFRKKSANMQAVAAIYWFAWKTGLALADAKLTLKDVPTCAKDCLGIKKSDVPDICMQHGDDKKYITQFCKEDILPYVTGHGNRLIIAVCIYITH